MPSIVTEEQPGLQPIGDAVPGLVRAVADAAIRHQGGDLEHPNRVKLRMAIEAHIGQARSMEPLAGAEFLGRCLNAVHRNRNNLADWAADQGELSPSLAGLTIFDIDDAQFQLEAEQRRLRCSVAA